MENPRKSITGVLVGIAASLFVVSAQAAAITASSTNVQIVTAPADISGNGPLGSNTLFTVFEEQTTSVTALAVNSSLVGDSLGLSTSGSISGAITSFFVHYDPVSANSLSGGFLEFDGPIVGIIWQTDELDATDGILGLAGTTYLPAGFRRYETGGSDTLDFSTANRVDFSATTTSLNVDSFRVLIAADAIPEPGAFALFGIGLAGLGYARRKRAA